MVRLATVDRVSHEYGRGRSKRAALSGLTFELRPGVTGLVGLNGAGKSTLLNLLAGILDVQSGRIDWSIPSQLVSLLPQATRTPRGFTVRQFLEYGAWLQGESGAAARGRAPTSLALVGLEGYEERGCSALSGGERRRLAFANAMSRQPDVLLLDEPTAGLDPDQRIRMRKAILASGALATVISSHLVEDILAVADRVLIMNGGRLIMDAGTSEVIDHLSLTPNLNREEAFVRLLSGDSV